MLTIDKFFINKTMQFFKPNYRVFLTILIGSLLFGFKEFAKLVNEGLPRIIAFVGLLFNFVSPFYIFGRGNLTIEDYCSFGEFTKFWNFEEINIGDDFMAAEGLSILTESHDPDTLAPVIKSVVIGDRVWCGANVTRLTVL